MSDQGIFGLSGIDYNIAGGGFRLVMISGRTLSVEGVRSLAYFDALEIKLRLKQGFLTISGENLRVTSLSKGYASVSGIISAVTLGRS